MNFEAVIGLEIHVETKSNSKMFSSSPNKFSTNPNSQCSVFDLAFPGVMPSVNKKCVINALRVCHALHMKIDNELWFDRKNYFYSDLPKGYQITQQFRPIGKDGYLILDIDDKKVRINIERLHMEEDTCKQLHLREETLLDYNRAGVPLIEIVSRPEIKNGLEAMKYVEKIRDIVTYADVSDGKMEEGSLRCDVNVSIRPVGSDKFGTKVEIKNLNSLANIQKAIDFEIKRHAVDYKYFTEPNIIPILLSDEFITDAITSCPELLDHKLERYMNEYKLSKYDSLVILSNKDNANYFEEILKYTNEYKLAANWVSVDIQSYLNKTNKSILEFPISSKDIATLINAIKDNKVSNKIAKDIFNKALQGENIEELLEKSNQVSDVSELLKLVNEVLDQNQESINLIKNGKDRALGFLVGQVMKLSKGKANPALTSKLIKEEIEKR